MKVRLPHIYDSLTRFLLEEIQTKILELCLEIRPGKLLDVCCGTGAQLKRLSAYGIYGTGIDISAQMLKHAKRGIKTPRIFQMDATHLDFPDHTFDCILISLALHENNQEQIEIIINEMNRVLKPAGTAIIVDYQSNNHSPFYIKAGIHFLERIAGKKQYNNFIQFIKRDNMIHLLEKLSWQEQEVFFYYKNSIALRTYSKPL